MSRSTYVPDDIWMKIRSLSNNEKLLYLYLLTNRQNNISGYYNFDAEAAMNELDFEVQVFKSYINVLVDKELIVTDKDITKILILDYLMMDKVANANQYKGVNRQLSGIKPNRLHFDFFFELVSYSPNCLDYLDDNTKQYLANNFMSSGNTKDNQIESYVARKLPHHKVDDWMYIPY